MTSSITTSSSDFCCKFFCQKSWTFVLYSLSKFDNGVSSLFEVMLKWALKGVYISNVCHFCISLYVASCQCLVLNSDRVLRSVGNEGHFPRAF